MPVLIPIVAAGAAYFGTAAVMGTAFVAGLGLGTIATVAVGAVVGAVIGAAVGAVGTAIAGGDIGKGALFGAIGGAIAGGFAGYSAANAASSVADSNVSLASGAKSSPSVSSAVINGSEVNGANLPSSSSGGFFSNLSDGSGTLLGAGVTALGNSVSGYAQGEATAQANEDTLAAASETADKGFEAALEQIEAQHQANMEEIASEAESAAAIADSNNAAAMDQLNTEIQAAKDTVSAEDAREDQLKADYNTSVTGTSNEMFRRPTFQYEQNNEPAETAFDSGFAEAVAKKESAPVDKTPEELLALEEKKVA